MNLSVTHAWRKGDFKSVFGINCTKVMINFIILPKNIYKETRTTIRDGLQVAAEKNQDLRSKRQNFIINYEH